MLARTNSSGQILLIVMLSVSVVTIVALSVISKSLTEVRLSSVEDDAGRAFTAAEAGIERALIVGSGVSGINNPTGSGFTATVTGIAEGATEYNLPDKYPSGSTATVWLVGHDTAGRLVCDPTTNPCYSGADTSLKVCWGGLSIDAPGSGIPAMEISVYYDLTRSGVTSNNWKDLTIARTAFDPDSSRVATNFFTNIPETACTVDTKQYEYSVTIDKDMLATLGIDGACTSSPGCLLAIKARPLYNLTNLPIAVSVAPGVLPSQGKLIESIGTAGSSSRKVQVYQSFGDVPTIFDNSIFSPQTIRKDI